MTSPVYNQLLFQKLLAPRGLGMAYMHPECPCADREIEIGDVGFFQNNGAFTILFNAMEKNADRGIVGFQPLILPQGIGDTAEEASADGFILRVEKSPAAFIINQTQAFQKQIAHNRVMEDYMRKNRDSWFDFAFKIGWNIQHKDDIVFISGFVKTRTWLLGLVEEGSNAIDFTIRGQPSDNPQDLMVAINSHRKSIVRSGPAFEYLRIMHEPGELNKLSDQCIFLNYYKAKTRWILGTKIEGNAGPDQSPSGNDRFNDDTGVHAQQDFEEEVTVEHLPPRDSLRTPFDPALDYILKYDQKCEVAITSDTAVKEVMIDGVWPEDITDIEIHMPNIYSSEDHSYATISIEELILRKYQQRSSEQREEFEAEQLENTANEEETGPSTNVPEDRWRYCEIIQGKWESGTFEWPHMKLGEPNEQIAAAISSVAVSHDSMLVAGGYEDGTVHVWRMDTGMLALKLPGHETEDVQCMSFSPDSRYLAAGASSGKVMVWNVETGEAREITAHDTDIWCIAYSPDGNTMATGSADCTVKLWNTNTYSLRVSLTDHPSVIQAIQFSPDSTLLVSASQDYGKVWDVTNGNLVATLAGHENVIWTVSFSPDSLRIITGSEDNTSRVWDAQNGDELVTIREHTSPVWASQFSADGREVMTGSYDSTVSICDSYVGTQRLLLRHVASTITSGCYSPDSEFVVAGYAEGSINVWSTLGGPLVADLKGHEDKVKSVTVTADSKHIVSASEDGSIRIWSIEDICRLATAF
ncbi:hypothetical protein QCA50_010092 [Cerrena zonata]|uniref:WD40 repeat-like protein n=1 Tax=Cerrena zonata TaxID=2478898 RepID=A0AAW0G565_9APHY